MGGVIAERIRSENLPVTIVTPEHVVSDWCYYTSEQYQVEKRLRELGIEIKTTHNLLAYDGQKVTIGCIHTGRHETIQADALIMVTARQPRDALYHDLRRREEGGTQTSFRSLQRIGDCDAPAIIAASVYAGHRYAREFDSEPVDLSVKFE